MIRLANKSQVPVITFSATSPLLTSTKTPYFVRATLNDLSQVRAIAAIVKSFEWRSVVAIYVDNEFGEGIMPYLADALQDVHTCITIRSVISLEASNDQITNQLYKLMTMQTRVFVAHMPPNLGFRVIQKARDIGMMGEGVNTDFRGPPHHQIGTSFWFSFSTINFAHREKVVSNLARFVVIVWCFVVLVLTQSYTANLTSFLTVQRLKPEVTTVNELIKNEEIVGYQNGSFVLKFLINKGFQGSKLKAYNSAEECHTLLITGTSKGGIAAAFDEVAYLKVIISQYCNKYAIVEPSFKSSAFGFVFPKNSPLTDDVSRAILEVIENDEMQQIEDKWCYFALGSSRLCGLFLYEDSEISFWRKLTILVRSFDEKDIKSHMFKDSAVHNVSSPSTQCTPRSSTMQNIPWPQNPSENMEFELRRVSLVPSEEFFTPQLEQDEDEEANTLREVE
ncbi:hypothetical protein Bca101_039669 [Brassica carinata]